MGRCHTQPVDRCPAATALGWAATLLALGLVGMPWGCARHVLSPAELPAEYQAPVCTSANRLDLTKLAQYSANSQRVERGDILEVSIVVDSDAIPPLIAPVRVAEDGCGNIPQIGRVELAGFELEQAEQAITAAAISRDLFRNPHITVTMKEQRVNRVTVLGAVSSEGVHELPRGSSTLLAALVAAGPLTDNASPDVEIRHTAAGGPAPGVPASVQPRVAGGAPGQLTGFQTASAQPLQSLHINLISATQQENINQELNDGDIVMVAKQPPRTYHVLGLVQKPGPQELPPDQELNVLDAIAEAGGPSSLVADNILIVRHVAGSQEPIQIQTTIEKAKRDGTANVRIAPGDIVSVEQTPTTFVWDLLRNLVRFGIGGTISAF